MIINNIQLPYGNQSNKCSKATENQESFTNTLSQLLNTFDNESDVTNTEEANLDIEENLFIHPMLIGIQFITNEVPKTDISMEEFTTIDSGITDSIGIPQDKIQENSLLANNNLNEANEVSLERDSIPHLTENGLILGLKEDSLTSKVVDSPNAEILDKELPNEKKIIPINNTKSSRVLNDDSLESKEKTVESVEKEDPNIRDKDLLLQNKTPFAETLIENKETTQFSKTINETNPVSRENIDNIGNSIVKLVETTNEGQTSVMKVQLYPEDLGTVDVILKMNEGKLVAKIIVESEQIKQMFTSKINELSENMIKQNIHVEKVEIELTPNLNLDSQSDFSEGFNRGNRNQFKRNPLVSFEKETLKKSSEDKILNNGAISILA